MFEKKKTLIITTKTRTNDKFIDDIFSRLNQYDFLQIYEWTGDNSMEELKDYLIKTSIDILFVCPSASDLPNDIILLIDQLIQSLKLSIVFFTGFEEKCLPVQLNYLNLRSTFSYPSSFVLNVKEIKNLKSLTFENEILNKYYNLINETFNNNLCENLGGTYLTGIKKESIKNLNDWIILSFSNKIQNGLYCSMIHKKYKVLFSHWYGYAQSNNDFSQDLTKVSIYYILNEHCKYLLTSEKYKEKLFEKTSSNQLIDITINTLE
ncbi:hypothetical protein ABK040_001675 [Willaertia magna]